MKLGALPQLVALLDYSGARSSSAQRTAVLACNLLCLVAAEPACKGAFLEGGMLQDLLAQLRASDASGEPIWPQHMHTGCMVKCHDDRRCAAIAAGAAGITCTTRLHLLKCCMALCDQAVTACC